MLDQSWHHAGAAEAPAAVDVMAFEAAALKKHGIDFAPVPPRYHTPYFSPHLGRRLRGRLLRLPLDAKCWTPTRCEWFKENGGLTRANGDRFRDTLLSRGGSKDALQLFRDFTGQRAADRAAARASRAEPHGQLTGRTVAAAAR